MECLNGAGWHGICCWQQGTFVQSACCMETNIIGHLCVEGTSKREAYRETCPSAVLWFSSATGICMGGGALEGAQLEALAHLKRVEAALVPQVVLLQPPLDELHGKAAGIHGRSGVQRREHLHQGPQV